MINRIDKYLETTDIVVVCNETILNSLTVLHLLKN